MMPLIHPILTTPPGPCVRLSTFHYYKYDDVRHTI